MYIFATIANPLAKRAPGTQRQIGRHIDMKVNATQTFIIIHKGNLFQQGDLVKVLNITLFIYHQFLYRGN